LDVTSDLERVDGAVTQILKDRSVWDEFLRDPNGVFVRLGLHPPTSAEINERANKAFYATVTNRRLIQLLTQHYKDYHITEESRHEIIENLRRGKIENPLAVDLAGMEHLLSDTDTLREALRLTLHDLNEKGILEARYPPEDLDNYVEDVISAIFERRAVGDHPTLERWDRHCATAA
jgi:hypothetical protein